MFILKLLLKKTNYNGSTDYLRNRLGKHGHDNPAFLDDANLNPKSKKK
jgi:hypothetical protein